MKDTRPLSVKPTDRQLKRRLLDARLLLSSPYLKMFPKSVLQYDFAQQRLYGRDGFYIQWTADHTTFGACSVKRVLPQGTTLSHF